MILHGVSYSAYTLWYGSYCRYRIAPSSQSSFDLFTVCFHLTFYGLISDVCLGRYFCPWCFPQCCAINITRFHTSSSSRLLTFPLARVYQHTSATSILDVEVSLSCHGRKARLSLRAMAPSTREKNLGLTNPRWRIYIYHMMKEALDRCDKKLNEISEKMDQHVTRLEHGARQPRLATESDGQQQTRRPASARRAPLQQNKRCEGITFLLAGLNPARRPTRRAS